MRRIFNYLRSAFGPAPVREKTTQELIDIYLGNGRIPWSEGYVEYRWQEILRSVNDSNVLESFASDQVPPAFGVGIDERIVEYSWIFSRIRNLNGKFLDAGSTFNYNKIIDGVLADDREWTIYTYAPEGNCYYFKKVNYIYGDLRNTMIRDEYFDSIISISTIEHIDMDNSIYGYNESKNPAGRSYEYLKAVEELFRMLKDGGKMFITFPFGKFENHGFFQQFDQEMLNGILTFLEKKGQSKLSFFKYESSGWIKASADALTEVVSFNPHTGIGRGGDGAAHCRSICCIEFFKSGV